MVRLRFLVNADGEIFIDEHEVAYKSIKKNTILPINQLKTGKCKITFKSVKYMDTKELIIEKDQTQLVEFTFPEPPVPKGLMQISGGSFSMGSKKGDRAEQPVHTVSIGTYAIGITEVTVGQFNSFIQGTRYRTTAEMNGKAYIVDKKNANFKQEKNISWRKPGYEGSDDHPVSCVSWFDAISYCNWRSAQENLQPCYSLNHSYNPGDWTKEQSSVISWQTAIACPLKLNGSLQPGLGKRKASIVAVIIWMIWLFMPKTVIGNRAEQPPSNQTVSTCTI
jgi:formylglycine-generating enzyme required for sulfatase activity